MTGGQGRSGESGAIFFLTDYGQDDELAGVVRAVLARLAPGAPVVDLTHEIAPFDVRAGALALERAAPHLGDGVVLAVVDPGVGTARRAVAVEVGERGGGRPHALVGPDNGLLLPAADVLGGVFRAVTLASPVGQARTFDGRDLFAPAAAALCRGEALTSLGQELATDELVRLPDPWVARYAGALEAEVLWVDRFGNVQLAATAADGVSAGMAPGVVLQVELAGRRWAAPFVGTFEDVGRRASPAAPAATEVGVLVDANGRLAMVCTRRSAATVLGVQSGDVVTLRLSETEDPPR